MCHDHGPLYVAIGAFVGYLSDGWSAAIFTGALMGLSAAVGGWWFLRREKA